VEIFDILGPHSHPSAPIDVKFCTAKRTPVHVGTAKFDLNRCNESPLRGEIPDFCPVSKNNTGSLPLRGILPVTRNKSIVPSRTMHTGRMPRTPITRVELITISAVTIKVFGTTLRPIFCVFDNFRRKFANLMTPPTDGTTKRLVRC